MDVSYRFCPSHFICRFRASNWVQSLSRAPSNLLPRNFPTISSKQIVPTFALTLWRRIYFVVPPAYRNDLTCKVEGACGIINQAVTNQRLSIRLSPINVLKLPHAYSRLCTSRSAEVVHRINRVLN